MSSPIIIDQVFKSQTIALSQSATHDFELVSGNYEGFFSFQLQIVSGAGVLTFDFLESNDGTNFVDAGAGSDVATGVTGAGHYLYSFDPKLCAKLRLRLTETGGAAGVVVNGWLAVQ